MLTVYYKTQFAKVGECLNEYFCLKSLVVRENVKILYVTTFYFGGT